MLHMMCRSIYISKIKFHPWRLEQCQVVSLSLDHVKQLELPSIFATSISMSRFFYNQHIQLVLPAVKHVIAANNNMFDAEWYHKKFRNRVTSIQVSCRKRILSRLSLQMINRYHLQHAFVIPRRA